MYKITGADDSNELPSNWAWTTLDYILYSIESGSRPKGGAKDISEGIPSIGGEHLLYSGGFDFSNTRYIPISFFENMSRGKIQKDDVLVVKDGATTGKTGFVSGSFPFQKAAVNEHVFILRPYKNQVEPKYLFFWMVSPYGQKCVATNFKGTAQGGITSDFIQNSQFPLAPYLEQHRIVAKIDELFSQLDAAETALRRAKANLERYQRSVLQAAVTGELTRTWREENQGQIAPAHEAVANLEIDRRRKWEYDLRPKGRDPGTVTYQKPAVPDKAKLPVLSTEWDWASASQVGDINEQPVLTGPFGSTLGQEDFIESGVPVLTIGCLTDKGLSLEKAMYIHVDKALELDRYRVRSGDILFSRMASVGRAALVTPAFEGAIINYHLMRLRLASAVISPSYFVFFVKGSPTVRDYVREVNHGATRDGINTEQLSGLPIALPPLEEQEEIIRKIEEYLSFKEYEQSAIDQSLHRISRLRQSILIEAFHGHLVDQNPEDEPASVLLQRIQAEREEKEKQKVARPKREKKNMSDEKMRKPLVETLHVAGTRLTPEELFRRAGFDEESVDEFFEELRQELQVEINGMVVKPGRIREERPNEAFIYLSEVNS